MLELVVNPGDLMKKFKGDSNDGLTTANGGFFWVNLIIPVRRLLRSPRPPSYVC